MNNGLRALVTIFSINAFVTALDYGTGNSYEIGTAGVVNELPIVWAISLTLVGVLSLAGAWGGCLALTKIGALAGAWTYILFAVTVWEPRMWPIPWPPEDMRLPADHLTVATVWALILGLVWFRQRVEKDKEKIREEISDGGHAGAAA